MFLPIISPFPSPFTEQTFCFIASFGLGRMASWLLIVQAYTEIGVWRRIKRSCPRLEEEGGSWLHNVPGQLNTRSEDPASSKISWHGRNCAGWDDASIIASTEDWYRKVPLKLLSHVGDRKTLTVPKGGKPEKTKFIYPFHTEIPFQKCNRFKNSSRTTECPHAEEQRTKVESFIPVWKIN